MDSKKLEMAQKITGMVRNLCSVVFNIQSDEKLTTTFGISHEQLDNVIKKVVEGLPNTIFGLSPGTLNEIENICAREFIFFQIQEKWNDPHYQEDLENFIQVFSRDIQKKISLYKEDTVKMRERE